MIEGLRKPDSGTVTIDGQDPWKRDPELQRRLGVQLQSPAFVGRLTAREQLVTFAAPYGAPAECVDELLAAVGLEDKAGDEVQ
jgi:ABC-2 type transport system ATP-binding protein